MSNDINEAVNFAMQKCWDESVGYSQTTRYLNPNVDCSALIYYALQAGDFDVPSSPWYTGNMMSYLRSMGFTEYIYDSSFTLQHGDICVHREGSQETGRGHACMIAENVTAYTANCRNYPYSTMEGYPDTTGIVSLAKVEAISTRGHPENGDQANNIGAHTEVYVHLFEGLSSSYTWHIFRWGGSPGPTPPPPNLPIWQMFKMTNRDEDEKRRYI